MRELVALLNGKPVGLLRDVDGLWSFTYDPGWLGQPQRYALSAALPLGTDPVLDGSSARPVQWYFDNLLPEEGQRRLLASDARIDVADTFALLAHYGAESAGALTLLPPEQVSLQAVPSITPLPDNELDARIRNLPRVSLMHGAIKRMSLAGAQHKLAVVLQDGALHEPAGDFPSTHILKPNHPDQDYPHSVINEWFVMCLARQLGLDVPAVHRRYVPAPVYLIDRFDRRRDEYGWQRRHVIDACQLLGLDKTWKYQQGSIEALAQLARACRSSAVARSRLFGWLVFNVLVGNTDAHLKNLSFLVSHEGIQLAPFYDLLSTAAFESAAFGKTGWPAQSTLAWPILGVNRFAEINRALLLDAGVALGIARPTAERLLEKQRVTIVHEAQMLMGATEAGNAALLQNQPALAATFAGELRSLRAIVEVVIKETVALLR